VRTRPRQLKPSSISESGILLKRPFCIGVAGGSGSGKTTVAERILKRVGTGRILQITQDRYYRDLSHLPMTDRSHRNFDHPNSIDSELLVEDLQELLAGRNRRLPRYDFTRHVRLPEGEEVVPRPVILLEGILIFALPEIRRLLDLKIFVDTDADIRFLRRLQRDIDERGRTVESVIEQYLETVRPMHLEFVEPSKRWADIIIPEGGFNTVALDVVISRIERVDEDAFEAVE